MSPTSAVVELSVDDSVVTNLAFPYEYTLPTADLSEGSHSIRAASGTATETISLVVDRTPPQIIGRTPAPGETNVDVRAPLAIDFSEPLDPSSVSSLTVAVSNSAGTLIAAIPSVVNGTRIEISLTTPPIAPASLGVTLNGVRDVAGNAVSPEAWSFAMPAWLQLGGIVEPSAASDAFASAQAISTDGTIFVAFTSNSNMIVSAFDGTTWSVVGSPTELGNFTPRSLAVTSGGAPALAWLTGAGAAIVARFQNGSWVPLGTTPTNMTEVSVATAPDGELYRMMRQTNNPPVVEHWTGTSWASLPGATSLSGGVVNEVSFGISPDGLPTLAIIQTDTLGNVRCGIRQFSTSWSTLGEAPAFTSGSPKSYVQVTMAWSVSGAFFGVVERDSVASTATFRLYSMAASPLLLDSRDVDVGLGAYAAANPASHLFERVNSSNAPLHSDIWEFTTDWISDGETPDHLENQAYLPPLVDGSGRLLEVVQHTLVSPADILVLRQNR